MRTIRTEDVPEGAEIPGW